MPARRVGEDAWGYYPLNVARRPIKFPLQPAEYGYVKDPTAAVRLREAQNADGGWGDVPTIPSGAYATGRALVALNHSGMAVSDPVYQRGMQYLMNRQQPDGSWVNKNARWMEGDPNLVTGYALLALSYCRPDR